MTLNIALGLAIADFKSEFDKERLILGIKKGTVVYVSIAVLSGMAQFIRFADIDLIGTMSIIVYGVMALYVVQDIEKISKILGYKNESEQ